MYRKCNSRTPREQNMFRISLPSEWTETRQRGPPQGRNNQGRQDWETRRQQIWKNTVVEHQDLIHWEVRIPIADAIWGTIEAGVLNNIGRRWSLCQREHRNARMYIYIYVYIVKESRIIFTSSITCIHIATENFCLLEGTDLQMDLTFCNPMTLVVFHPLCQCVQYDPILK